MILVIALILGVGEAKAQGIPYTEIEQIKDKAGEEKLKDILLVYPQFQEYAQWELTVDSAEKYPDGGIRTGFSFTLPSDFSHYGIAYKGSLWVVFWDNTPEIKQPASSAEELKEKIKEFESLPEVQEFVKLYQPQSNFIDTNSILLADINYIWGYHIVYNYDKKIIDKAVLNPNFRYESFPQINQMIQSIRNFRNFPEGCLPFEGEIGYVESQKGVIAMQFDKTRDRMVYMFNTNYGENCAEQYFVRIHNGVVEIQPEQFEE